MMICEKHWKMCRKAIEERDLFKLCAQTPEDAAERLSDETFDPLLAMNFLWTNAAIENGGVNVLCLDEDGHHLCPICLFEEHAPDFDALTDIGECADEVLNRARELGLAPGVQ